MSTEGPKCQCGCGDATKGGRFLPGHDAKLKSALIREALAGGNPEAEQELKDRGWWHFVDKARNNAERKANRTPREPKQEQEGGNVQRLYVLKAAAKVLKATGQYAKGLDQITLDADNLEGIVTLKHPKLKLSGGWNPDIPVATYFGWEPHEAEAVAEYLRLASA